MHGRCALRQPLLTIMPLRLLNVVVGAVFVLLLISAASKLLDLTEFRDALRAWQILPTWSQAVLVPAIPAVELSLSLLWFAGWQRRVVCGLTLILLVVFTAALVIERLFGTATRCACMGVLTNTIGLENGLTAPILRNIALLVPLLATMLRTRVNTVRLSPPAAATGFTLVELLVSIAIVGLLIACTLWGLSTVRGASRSAVAASRLQQHGAVFTMYAGDFRDQFPYFVKPSRDPTYITPASSPRPIEVLYFQSYHLWSAALADGYYSGQYHDGPFRSPFWRQPLTGDHTPQGNDFYYPCVFLAQPEFWNTSSREAMPNQLSSTRHATVLFPQRKVMIFHDVPYANAVVAAVLVDGHAATFAESKVAQDRIDDGGQTSLLYGGHWGGGERWFHTWNGLKGSDIN